MRSRTIVSSAAAALIAGVAFGQGSPCPGQGSCFVANGSPGCDEISCCNGICAADPFCCNTEWDSICANSATLLCAPPCPSDCLGDLNVSRTVDGADLGLLLNNWGGAGCGDLNNDGKIDGADLGLLLNNWGPCPLFCGSPNAGSCCTANGTPFCDDADCCALICASDLFCCDVAWDSICSSAAVQECTPCFECGSSGAGTCCAVNETPFCDDADCCLAVCAADPFCCSVLWDSACASAAQSLPQCGCAPPSCPGARIDFGVTPDDFGNANACSGAGPIPITTQYVLTQSIVFGTAISQFPAPPVGIVGDSACDPECRSSGLPAYTTDWSCQFRLGAAAGVPGALAGVTSFSAELCSIQSPPGTVLMQGLNIAGGVVASATNTVGGTETLSISVTGQTRIAFVRVLSSDPARAGGLSIDCLTYPNPVEISCPAADHNCFTTGGPGCTDSDCCIQICAADPFCCLSSWDGACVNQANASCAGCGNPNAGDCCEANGTPFCDDRNCCTLVCAVDPFCCTTSWDGVCVGQVASVCDQADCIGASCAHSPCVTGAALAAGCDSCVGQICAVDPFCCANSWDSFCVGQVLSVCGLTCP